MRLLGYQCIKLNNGRYHHPVRTTDILNEQDSVFFDKLINPTELPTIQPNKDNTYDDEIEYEFHTFQNLLKKKQKITICFFEIF